MKAASGAKRDFRKVFFNRRLFYHPVCECAHCLKRKTLADVHLPNIRMPVDRSTCGEWIGAMGWDWRLRIDSPMMQKAA